MDFSLITHALPETIAVDGMALHLDTRTVRALQALAVTAEDDIPAEVRIPRVAELMLTPQSMLELRRHPKDTAMDFPPSLGCRNGKA